MGTTIEYVASYPYGNALEALKAWRDDPDDEAEVCCYCGEELIADERACPGCGMPATKLTVEDWSVDR